MFENVNTIIFDMDGTVLNTLEDLTVSVNYVLSQFDMPDHPEEEYRKFFGNGIKVTREYIEYLENEIERLKDENNLKNTYLRKAAGEKHGKRNSA